MKLFGGKENKTPQPLGQDNKINYGELADSCWSHKFGGRDDVTLGELNRRKDEILSYARTFGNINERELFQKIIEKAT